MPVDLVRDAAIDVLLRVFQKDAHIGQAIDRTLRRKKGTLSPRGQRFMTQLVYGTTRNLLLADYILKPLLHQPQGKLPVPIQFVLRMGVFQSLFCGNVTFPAMVHTSVDLAKKRGHLGTSRLVNAVLKKVPSSLDEVVFPDRETDFVNYLSIRYSVSRWLVTRWISEHGETLAEEICEAACSEAPRCARVNTLVTTRDELIRALQKAETPAIPHPEVEEAIIFAETPIPFRSKVFQQGHFFIQDPASMLPPNLLRPEPNQTILDLCAAPGGKSTHLAELARGESLVIANDITSRKMGYILENLGRLGTPGLAPLVSDSNSPPFANGSLDAVLLDAPCSGLGTLRRRPDLKWRIKENAIARLADQQKRLLRSAIRLCKNDGVIVYSVCTFTPEETDQVIAAIKGEESVRLEDGPEWLNPWKISQGQYKILPKMNGPDGYFMARLRKTV